MADALRTINTRVTPQSKRALPEQTKNAAGGYVFTLADDLQLHRFLTMGVAGSTFYVGERELADEAGDLVARWAREKGTQLVEKIVEISVAGRAPRVNACLFALAVASALGDDVTRTRAYDALPSVARTGSHLFTWAQYRSQFAGVGRGYRRAVANWYLGKTEDKLAYQMVKYRQREGWDHRRLIDLSHPQPDTSSREGLFRWAKGMDPAQIPRGDNTWFEHAALAPDMPAIWVDYQDAKATTEPQRIVSIIKRGNGISWEMLPDFALTSQRVWGALLEQGMPMTALFRQLPRLTRLGVLKSDELRNLVTTQLTDVEMLRRGRVHPINVLIAARTYQGGQGKGGAWEPVARVVDALDESFYAAFETVVPAGKRTLIALDTSGSMGQVIGTGTTVNRVSMREPGPGELSCRDVAAALALVQMKSEPNYEIIGFTGMNHERYRHGYRHQVKTGSNEALATRLTLSARQRLDDACKYIDSLPFGPTDCSLPMRWAQDQGMAVDTFVIYTDNQTFLGQIHPFQALRRYREATGIQSRLVVVGMAGPLWHSIADPNDPLSIDVAGFDSAVPNLINDFSRGDL